MRQKGTKWAHAGEDHPASHDPSLLCPPLLLLLQADEGTLQVSAVLCVLSGREKWGIRLGTRREGPALPHPGTHPQPLLLQLCGSLQQLLLQL